MPRISVPADRDPLAFLWSERARGLTPSAAAYTAAVYQRSTLPAREFEAARITIAGINGCQLCLGMRAGELLGEDRTGGAEVDEAFYAGVLAGDRAGLTDREALAAEFARRFATDHLAMDDDLWARLHAVFTDDELVDLGLCVGSWLALGRLNQVFDVDGGCRVPDPGRDT